MNKYKLVAKIEELDGDEVNFIFESITGKEFRCCADDEWLIIDDNYGILRTTTENFIIYLHYKNDRLIKMCFYKREKNK